MRIKILIVNDDINTVIADEQLLKERGFLVYTCFNTDNIDYLMAEIKPDVLFFDTHNMAPLVIDAYNRIVTDIEHTTVPVIYTLVEDDVYLINRKRTTMREKRNLIADNIIDAIKFALQTDTLTHKKKTIRLPKPQVIPLSLFGNARA